MISSSPFFLSATSSSFSSQNSHRRVNLFHPRPTFHREIFSPQNRLIFVSTVSNELWHFPIFPIRLAMLIFPNKSRYGVSSPYVPSSISSYFQSLFITLFFRVFPFGIYLSLDVENGMEEKVMGANRLRKHRSASRVCLSFIVSVPRFSPPFSLSPSLSPPPSPQETSTSPFSFRPVETDYVFNGVPLVWWEISFKPVVVSLVACLLCQSFKIRRIRGKFVLSEGCCTNFYLSANWKINFDGSSFFRIE